MAEKFNIVWLKRDLRIEDHVAFFEARKHNRVISIYMIEPEYWHLPDTSGRQWNFIEECLVPLSNKLVRLGIPLLFFHGSAELGFAKLLESIPVSSMHSHQETGNYWTYQRDINVGHLFAANYKTWLEHMQHGVFRKLDTRNGWANRWDAMMLEPAPPLPARQEWPTAAVDLLKSVGFSDSLIAPETNIDACPFRQKGGREEGLALLASFLAGRGENYRRAMSSPLEGADACSRISTHLAYGTLSMREVFQASVQTLRGLEKDNPATKNMRQSLVSFIGRLHWHCHFIQKLETTPAIEYEELHPAYRGLRTDLDAELLDRWIGGQTGWPFLDACMRSLQSTGWLNFRMRAMVMAVASYHFWQPWQQSGKKLARLFTDYEPGIHWPQVQMQSGTTGINTIRIYNPVKQGYDQDPEGIFIKRWVPELAHLEGKEFHEPWRCSMSVKNYASIMLEHQAAARQARERIWSVRKQKGFHEKAKSVLDKHSSRRTLKQSDHKRRQNGKLNPDQMSFDW